MFVENKHLTLVFAETKRNVNDLGRFLHQRGYPVTTIHGDKAQPEREYALLMFRSGTYPILVATAVSHSLKYYCVTLELTWSAFE